MILLKRNFIQIFSFIDYIVLNKTDKNSASECAKPCFVNLIMKIYCIYVLHISHFICIGIYAFNLKNWFVLTLFVVLFTKILILQPMAESSFKANLLHQSPTLLQIYFAYIMHSILLQDTSHYPLITFLHSTLHFFPLQEWNIPLSLHYLALWKFGKFYLWP